MKTLALLTLTCMSVFAQSYDSNSSDNGQTDPGSLPWFYNSNPSSWYGRNDLFRVGDSYHIAVAGRPYSPITVVRWQNGYPNTTLNFTCDANGMWIYDGVVQPTEIGFWTETWTVDDATLQMLEFTIYPQGWDGSTPTVYFINRTTGNTDFLNVGDQYEFIWVGSPYATMAKNGVFNGQTLTYPSTWQLGAGGFTTYFGTVLDSEAGVWTESWTFNGVPANTLHFAVSSQP